MFSFEQLYQGYHSFTPLTMTDTILHSQSSLTDDKDQGLTPRSGSELEFQALSYSVATKDPEDGRKVLVGNVSAKLHAGEVSLPLRQQLTPDARYHGTIVSSSSWGSKAASDGHRGAGKSTLLDLMAFRKEAAGPAEVCHTV